MTLSPTMAPLARNQRWLNWVLVPDPRGRRKPRKVPVNPRTGNACDPTAPGNWVTYEEAAQTAAARNHGVAYVFNEGDGLWFLDIDNCVDAAGQWTPLAQYLMRVWGGHAGIEVSQSGTGLHVFGWASVIPEHGCRNIPLGLELYHHARFVAFTDHQSTGAIDADTSHVLAAVISAYFTKTAASRDVVDWCDEGDGASADDEDLLRIALHSGTKTAAAMFSDRHVPFAALWHADSDVLAKKWPSSNGHDQYDASEADSALAAHLVYWCGGNLERAERLMRRSALLREKWDDRKDYLERTILNAAATVRNRATPRDVGAPALEEGEIVPLDWSKLALRTPEPKQFIIPGLAPAGEVSLFTGPGSAGKSLWAQQVATAIAVGVVTLGLDMAQAPAIYLTCEDDTGQLHWRQAHICKALGISIATLEGKLTVASLRGRLDNSLGVSASDGAFTLSRAYERIGALIRRTGAKLVALDNVAHLFTGNENDRGAVTQFVNALNRLAGETGAAIVLIAHPNKAGDKYSGSTAWLNAVRSQIFLEHDADSGMRTMTVGKANYAPMGQKIRFAWVDWAFKLESELSPDALQALAESARANGEDAAFLRCLAACTAQRRNVSHQPGINYAPKIFAGMAEAKGVKKPVFEAVMERLLHQGKIMVDEELWKNEQRHMKRGIKAVVGNDRE